MLHLEIVQFEFHFICLQQITGSNICSHIITSCIRRGCYLQCSAWIDEWVDKNSTRPSICHHKCRHH